MVTVSYQILFTDKKDVKKELVYLLKNAFEGNYDEFEEGALESSILIKYNKQIDEYKFLVGFDLDSEEIGTEINSVITDFNENLQEHDNISLAIKFYDESLFSLLSTIYEKIFGIEMRLREAITLIFLDTYKSDYYNLLEDLNINAKLDKNPEQKRQLLTGRLENEFFHISFSDYIKLSNPRDLKHDDLFSIAGASNNFDEFKNNILNRGVTNPNYIAFIDEVKQIMDRLEKIRNCVAHNRTLSSEDMNNYEKYFEQIEKEIELFFENLEEEDFGGHFTDIWKEGGGDEVGNNLRSFSFKKNVLNFYNEENNTKKFSIEEGIMSYLRDKEGIWGLKFSDNKDILSAILVDLKQIPRTHQELWNKYLIK